MDSWLILARPSCPLLFYRCKCVVNAARAKLDLVTSEDDGMDEYEVSPLPSGSL